MGSVLYGTLDDIAEVQAKGEFRAHPQVHQRVLSRRVQGVVHLSPLSRHPSMENPRIWTDESVE